MTLPTYVINLDRRPDRWQSISDNLNRIGLTAHRISAIDALSLDRQTGGEHLGREEKACFLSHCKALSKFLSSSSHPASLILEDDTELARDLPGCLQSVDWWSRITGVVHLGINESAPQTTINKEYLMGPEIGQTPCGRYLYSILRNRHGCFGYLIDRETAQTILNHYAEPSMPIDRLMFNMRRSPLARRVKPVQINPALVRHIHSPSSDVAPSRGGVHEGRKISSRKQAKILSNNLYKVRLFGLKLIGKTNRMHIHYSDVHEKP